MALSILPAVRSFPKHPTTLKQMTFVIELSNLTARRSSLPVNIFGSTMIIPFTKAMDYQVDHQFRRDPSGRSAFLPLGRKSKAYFVDSKSEEEKIRSFVRMYRSASALIYWLGYLCFYVWILSFNTSASKWTTEVGISSLFCLLLLLPLWILWIIYKKTVPSFTSSLSEVGPDLKDQLSEISPPPRRLRGLALVGLLACIVVMGVGLIFVTRRSSPGKLACPPKCTSTNPVSQ
jgi:hypothetical protein